MYRHVLIDLFQNLQLILQRDIQLNTVTYGIVSVAFLASENSQNYPLESNIMANDFCFDDLLTGSNDDMTLFLIQQNLVKVLCQSQDSNYVMTDSQQNTKTLGFSWNLS